MHPKSLMVAEREISSPVGGEPPDRHSTGQLKRALVSLARDKAACAGLVIVLISVIAAVFAPYLATNNPLAVDLDNKLSPPSRRYPLGTDHLGRCVYSRLLYGGRVTIPVVAATLAVILLIGLPLGALSGYYGGWLDSVIMRVVDAMLAFPALVLALVIAGMLGPGLVNVALAMVAVWWVEYARLVRGMVLSVKERGFVQAAVSCGASDARVICRHILPEVFPAVAVMATLDMGKLLLAISGLSFLGLGAQPPTPEWGAMLNEGRMYLQSTWRTVLAPGAAIMLVALGFNLLGDGIRDVMDPRERTRFTSMG